MELKTNKNQTIYDQNFIFSEGGLEVVGEPSFEQWISCGQFIRRLNKSIHFVIGDWLNYGEKRWGEKYREAVELTKFDVQTLRNDKWIAGQIPQSRRRPELSFDHHQQVAYIDDEEEQDELLQKAVSDKINVKEFRKIIEKNKNELSGRPDKFGNSEATPKAENSGIIEKKRIDNDGIAEIIRAHDQYITAINSYDLGSLAHEDIQAIIEKLRELRSAISNKIADLDIRYGEE